MFHKRVWLTSDLITMMVRANQKEDEHRNRINPDVLITGIEFFDDNDKLDVVMEFIAKYVRKVYGEKCWTICNNT